MWSLLLHVHGCVLHLHFERLSEVNIFVHLASGDRLQQSYADYVQADGLFPDRLEALIECF